MPWCWEICRSWKCWESIGFKILLDSLSRIQLQILVVTRVWRYIYIYIYIYVRIYIYMYIYIYVHISMVCFDMVYQPHTFVPLEPYITSSFKNDKNKTHISHHFNHIRPPFSSQACEECSYWTPSVSDLHS